LEETKKNLEDFIKASIRIMVVTIAMDMKKHSIVSFDDYLTLLFFEHNVEKRIAKNQKHAASGSI
jgi:hypothetical protein